MNYKNILLSIACLWVASSSYGAETILTSENLHKYLSREIGHPIEKLPVLSSIGVDGISFKVSDIEAFCVGFFGKDSRQKNSSASSAWTDRSLPTSYYIVGTRQKSGSTVVLGGGNTIDIDGTQVRFVYARPHPTIKNWEVVLVKKNRLSDNVNPMIFNEFKCERRGKATIFEHAGRPSAK